MYRVVRASTLYYSDYMKNTGSRYALIKPFLLLTDTKKFQEAQEKRTYTYRNLCDIVVRMRKLYSTGEAIYHHFAMLLEELETLGFKVKGVKEGRVTSEEIMKDQIDLLLQFLAYRYPFDEYDNKTGTHDYITNAWIFQQP